MDQEIGYLKQHPREMILLGLTEMTQRFAFWGIGNILVLYLVQYYKYSGAEASHVYGIYTGFGFLLPILGGLLADRWNYRGPVWWALGTSALGCAVLATKIHALLYVGIVLIAIGSALFTPCAYALLNRFYHDKHHLRHIGFSIYYAGVCIGIFLGMLVLGPLIQHKYYTSIFVIAGVVQCLGFWPFARVSRLLKEEHISVVKEDRHAEVIDRKGKQRLIAIVALSLFSIVFWAAYCQQYSSVILMVFHDVNRTYGGWTIPAPWLITTQTFFLVALMPFMGWLYTALRRRKMEPAAPSKMAYSFIVVALSFGIIALGGEFVPHTNPLYIVGSMALWAVGELLLAPIGLSMITNLSPRKTTALCVGFYYFCIGAGFYIGGYLAGYMTEKNIPDFFSWWSLAMLVTGIVLLLFAKTFVRLSHNEDVTTA